MGSGFAGELKLDLNRAAAGPGPDLRAVAEGMVELVAHPVSAREALRVALEAGSDGTDPATDSPSLQ